MWPSGQGSLPDLPPQGDAATKFEFEMEQLVSYVAALRARHHHQSAGILACFSPCLENRAKASKKASGYFLSASLLGITYRQGQVFGDQPYLTCVPLDRISGVDVGSVNVCGQIFNQVSVAVEGENNRLDIVGLQSPVKFQMYVKKLQVRLAQNLRALGLPIVPSLCKALSGHHQISLHQFMTVDKLDAGDQSSEEAEPGLKFIKQHGRDQPSKLHLQSLGGGSASGGGSSIMYSPLSSFAGRATNKVTGYNHAFPELSSMGMAAYMYEATNFEDGGITDMAHCRAHGRALEEEIEMVNRGLSTSSATDLFLNPLYNAAHSNGGSVGKGALSQSAVRHGFLKPAYVGAERLCLKIESAAGPESYRHQTSTHAASAGPTA